MTRNGMFLYAQFYKFIFYDIIKENYKEEVK